MNTTEVTVGRKKVDPKDVPQLNLDDPHKPLISGTVTEPIIVNRTHQGTVLVGNVDDILAQLTNRK